MNLADPELAIEWPIPLDQATVSEADLNHPMLKDVVPMAPQSAPSSPAATASWAARSARWRRSAAWRRTSTSATSTPSTCPTRRPIRSTTRQLYGTVINCGAYTAVDRAETAEGRATAWKANATGPAAPRPHPRLGTGSRSCTRTPDDVFDGTAEVHGGGRATSARCPSTARPRPPATSPWPAARATTSCAAPGSSARATTSSRP